MNHFDAEHRRIRPLHWDLMCRFDPDLNGTIAEKKGFLPMTMKGREYKGYCYVEPIGFKSEDDFRYWVDLCLDYNKRAKPSKKRKNGKKFYAPFLNSEIVSITEQKSSPRQCKISVLNDKKDERTKIIK